jgi:hypothetical protein
MVPQPVKAIILLFPISETLERTRKEEDAKIDKDGQDPIDHTIIFFKQTVRFCHFVFVLEYTFDINRSPTLVALLDFCMLLRM